jgi:hypothetical protein
VTHKRQLARLYARQYRTYDRDLKRSYGRHSRWLEEGQEGLRWEAYVAEHPERAGDECPF